MTDKEQSRDFGRDGVSGLVDRNRALRTKLLPKLSEAEREARRAATTRRNATTNQS